MRLKEHYTKEVIPALIARFKYRNPLEVPKIVKVAVNIGINSQNKDAKIQETIVENLRRITGQAPAKTQAKKSISGFKVRQGMVVGTMVTLRGQRMYDFIERLVKIVLPRIRDFQGLSTNSMDKAGNMTLGFRETIAFPELQSDSVDHPHGLEITFVTTAKNKEEGLELLKLLGFPFKSKN